MACKSDRKQLNSSGIRAVLLDFGGVLAEEGFKEGLHAIGRLSGVPPDDMVRAGFDLVHRTGYVTGQAGESSFWDSLREEAGAKGTDNDLRREILSRFVIRPWMIRMVERLLEQGLVLGILSDQTQWLDELDREYGFLRHFHHVFNSYHTGVSKREPAAFDRAAAHMGLPADRILFVDDHPGNVERAQERGMKTILFKDQTGFQDALASHGLLLDANYSSD
ncbi:MAG: HAD family hydrolase [Thermodesulfobacteriota bacterium]